MTGSIFGHVATRSGNALADFRARPEHSRWRAYALGSYGLIVAATLVGQLYTDNVLGAYVRVQRVEVPAMTQIFVRNDSPKSWHNVRLTLNGIYEFRTEEVGPGGHVMLPVNKFAIRDQGGRATYAPRSIARRAITSALLIANGPPAQPASGLVGARQVVHGRERVRMVRAELGLP